MKKLFLKNRYTKAIGVAFCLMLLPALLASIGYLGTHLLEIGEGPTAKALFAFFFGTYIFSLAIGIPLFLLSLGIIAISLLAYSFKTLLNKGEVNLRFKKAKLFTGVVSVVFLITLLYIPAGPDECSRTITASQYTSCLERELQGKTEAEVRTWLEERGYKSTKNYPSKSWGTFGRENYHDLDVENYFEARRSYGRLKSLPYGTNFTRLVLPMLPAPAMFTIGIGIQEFPTRIYYIHPDWSFSFL